MKSILSTLIILASFSVSSHALEFIEQDGYTNSIKSTEQSKVECKLLYIVGASLIPDQLVVDMSLTFPDKRALWAEMRLPTEIFKDIFVTGAAFKPGYKMDEWTSEKWSVSQNNQNDYVVQFAETDTLNGVSITNEVTYLLASNLDLKEIKSLRKDEGKSTRKVEATCSF